MKKILLSRTDKLGDLVLAIPLATALKRDGNYVGFLVRKYQAPLLEHHPDVDEILFIEKVKPRDLNNFDVFIDVFPRFKTALLAFRAGIKTRIGTAYRLWSFLYNRRVKLHRRPSVTHEYIYNFKLLEPLGNFEPVKPRLFVTEEERKRARELLTGLKRPIIAVHPLEGGTGPDVDISVYRQITEYLRAKGINVIHIGQKKLESLKVDRDLGGETDLRILMAVISEVDLLISPSTGPMHIANALGTPTVSFFKGTGAVRPARWGPLFEKSKVIIGEYDSDKKILKVNIEKALKVISEFL